LRTKDGGSLADLALAIKLGGGCFELQSIVKKGGVDEKKLFRC